MRCESSQSVKPPSLPLEARGNILESCRSIHHARTTIWGAKKAMCSDRGSGATAHLLRLLSIIAIEVSHKFRGQEFYEALGPCRNKSRFGDGRDIDCRSLPIGQDAPIPVPRCRVKLTLRGMQIHSRSTQRPPRTLPMPRYSRGMHSLSNAAATFRSPSPSTTSPSAKC